VESIDKKIIFINCFISGRLKNISKAKNHMSYYDEDELTEDLGFKTSNEEDEDTEEELLDDSEEDDDDDDPDKDR